MLRNLPRDLALLQHDQDRFRSRITEIAATNSNVDARQEIYVRLQYLAPLVMRLVFLAYMQPLHHISGTHYLCHLIYLASIFIANH